MGMVLSLWEVEMNSVIAFIFALAITGGGYFIFFHCPYDEPGACDAGNFYQTRDDFIDECGASGEPLMYCECIVEGLEEKWSFQKYEQVKESHGAPLYQTLMKEQDDRKHNPDLSVFKKIVKDCS